MFSSLKLSVYVQDLKGACSEIHTCNVIIFTDFAYVQFKFCWRKFILGMFQQSV